MTSAISHSDRRRGFSLVELLVVIGIIVLLASIALPMLIKAYSQADKTKAAADLQAVSVALEAYHADFGAYPSFPNDSSSDRGARALCRALVGPAGVAVDGADGNGFRVRKTPGPDNTIDTTDDIGMGRVSGPYLQTDRLKIVTDTPGVMDETAKLATKDNKVILYYPASAVRPDKSIAPQYCDTDPPALYNASDNLAFLSLAKLRAMLGDFSVNGAIDSTYGTETGVDMPFILLTPGADGAYGPDGIQAPGNSVAKWNKNKASVAACDDVTNIQR